jgi:hypothetical protein
MKINIADELDRFPSQGTSIAPWKQHSEISEQNGTTCITQHPISIKEFSSNISAAETNGITCDGTSFPPPEESCSHRRQRFNEKQRIRAGASHEQKAEVMKREIAASAASASCRRAPHGGLRRRGEFFSRADYDGAELDARRRGRFREMQPEAVV